MLFGNTKSAFAKARLTAMATVAVMPMFCLPLSALAQNATELFTVKSVNTQGMGFVTGIVVQPSAPNYIYIRTDVGGIYRYDRGGERWIPLMDRLDRSDIADLGVESVAIDVQNANRIYMVAVWRGKGDVVVSDDAGATWRSSGLSSAFTVTLGANSDYRNTTGERLGVDPKNPNVLYLSTRANGIYKGARSGNNFTWSRIGTGTLPDPVTLSGYNAGDPAKSPGYTFVAFDKSRGTASDSRIYLGVYGRGVYFSDNGGSAWNFLNTTNDTKLNRPLRGVVSPSGNLYISTATSIYRYNRTAWTNVSPSGGDRFYDSVAVDPTTVAGSPEKLVAVQARNVWRSNNSGSSWNLQQLQMGSDSNPPNPSAPPYYLDYASDSNGGSAFDSLNPASVWWVNGFGTARTDNINATNPQWTWRMQNLEELVAHTVKVPRQPKADGGADLLAGVADMIGFRIENRDVVPLKKIDPTLVPLPYGLSSNSADNNAFNNQWNFYNNFSGVSDGNGHFKTPFPHVAGARSLDIAANAPNHVAFIGVHQWQSSWPVTGYSTDAGRTWISFPNVPRQLDNDGTVFLGSGGLLAIAPVVAPGQNKATLVWAPAAGTFGNPWWNTEYSPQDSRIPWPHYSEDGGSTWNLCKLASAADAPPFSLVNDFNNSFWNAHRGDLPKSWGNNISPWIASRAMAASPSDPTGNTFYYFCSSGTTDGSRWGIFYRSSDGGKTWRRGDSGKFPAYNVKASIIPHPYTANEVYLSFPGNDETGSNRLFRSTDGGDSFNPVATVTSCEYVTFGKGYGATTFLYVWGKIGSATKNALYRSADNGQSWIRVSENGYATISDMEGDLRVPNLVFFTTSGRGILYAQGRTPTGRPRLGVVGLTRNGDNTITVRVSITNESSRNLNLRLTLATLGNTSSNGLPSAADNVIPGQTIEWNVFFPAITGTAGSSTTLIMSGKAETGGFTSGFKVTIP